MSFTLGLIPAAGKGSRWGGYVKELLPCGDGEHLLDRTIRLLALGGAEAVLVVTSLEKLPILSQHLAGRDLPAPVFFTRQQGEQDMYSAMVESFAFPADRYLFAMPDTYLPEGAFIRAYYGMFGMGLFDTDRPERFGILDRGRVIDKSRQHTGLWPAWGALTWTRPVVEYWQLHRPQDYTQAINYALDQFGNDAWKLAFYHDMATWEDYQRWTASLSTP